MHQEQRNRTNQLLKEKRLPRALFAHPANVTWLTGMPQPWATAAYLYAGGPSLVWFEDETYTLLVMDGQEAAAAPFAQDENCQIVTYQGYAYKQQPAGATLLAATLKKISESPHGGSIGIEKEHLPVFLLEALYAGQSQAVDVVAIDGWLTPYRLTRTEEELDKMRENFALIDIAQSVVNKAVQPGSLELDVWTTIQSAIQKAAGQTLYLGNDCTVGRRMGGPALAVEILPTDSFIVDLSTIWKGYWSDSCVSYYATEPSPAQVAMHRAVADALDLAISLARPGTLCREIDQKVRRLITDQGYPTYPHHTGHGIGIEGHEAPRITPHSEERLQAGMVIMLEPGIYTPEETGVRLEHAVLVTNSGPEILSLYDLNVP